MTLNAGTYHKIREFSEGDPKAAEYFETQFELGRKLEDFLCYFYRHRIGVRDADVSADYWGVETDIEMFSDRMIRIILSFLREKSAHYSVMIFLYGDAEIIGSPYLGRAIITQKRIGVTLGIRDIFEAKCRDSVHRLGSILMFDEDGPCISVEEYKSALASTGRPRIETGSKIGKFEVLFGMDEKFDNIVRGERFYRVHKFAENDPSAREFYNTKVRLRDELAKILDPLCGENVAIPECDSPSELLSVFVVEDIFSDDLIRVVLSFLLSCAATYCVQLVLYANQQFDPTCYLGKVAITLNRFAVSGQLKQKFKEKCRNSLRLDGGPIIFEEGRQQDRMSVA